MTKNLRSLILLGVVVVAVGACASPRKVTKITGNDQNVKFIHYQKTMFSSKTGIVKCDLEKYNFTTNCRDLNLEFVGE